MTKTIKATEYLSTQGYRGTRDFYPDEQRLKNYMYNSIIKVLCRFGYEEYDGPFVEPLELYAAKSSEEIVRDQLYSFKDKGDRNLAIRPEMTPTLARMVAAKQREWTKPIRLFSIPTCMRFERPQRGRLREFDQLNVDIFGGNSHDEDLEILLTLVDIFKEFGASCNDFIIKVNHRSIMNNFLLEKLALNLDIVPGVFRLLDKRDKITAEVFIEEGLKLGLNLIQITELDKFLHSNLNDVLQLLKDDSLEIAIALKDKITLIQELTQSQCIEYSPQIMRGFDYYTGIIFEVYDTNPENRRALCGGGRYDNLVGAFGIDELPGIGYGMGDVALINFLESHKLTPPLPKVTNIAVIRFSEKDRALSLKLSLEFRKLNLNVENCVTNLKFGKQIQHAQKLGIPVVAFCGEEEIKNNSFAVKWLSTGIQEVFSFDETGFMLFNEKFKNLEN